MCAQQPLPELRTEAIDGGSVLHVRNPSSQPLTAFLIELVNYPGSYYALWQDDVAAPIPPGGQKRIQIVNMTVGAAPDYVKLRAALYADGTSAGVPEKVKQFVERRRFVLATTRQLIERIGKVRSSGSTVASLGEGLRAWADSIPQPTRSNRATSETVNNNAARGLIEDTARAVESSSLDAVLAGLRKSEQVLAASKPAL